VRRDWRLLAAVGCILANFGSMMMFLRAQAYQQLACANDQAFCDQSAGEIIWDWLAIAFIALALVLIAWAYFRPVR
jgi:hypothetical protein